MRTVVINGHLVDPANDVDEFLNLVIDGERVVEVTPAAETTGARVIDASGMVVMPGFIDAHTHSDFRLPVHPEAHARLHQGITTDITGNCGFSPFPLGVEHQDFGAFIGDELPTRWKDLDSYAGFVEDVRPTINLAPLVGLGSVRTRAMAKPENPAAAEDITRMRRLVESALEQGAFGVSSGLVYFPNSHMDAAETAAVLAPLAESDRIYASHLRDERNRVVDSVTEILEVSRRAGIRVQVSHHKALGRENWGSTATTLAMMDAFEEETGRPVGVDFYPFTSGSTGISSLLPPGVLADGFGAFRANIVSASFRAGIRDHLEQAAQFRLDEITIGTSLSRPEVSGRALLEAAEHQSLNPLDLVIELLASEGESITMLVEAASEQDLALVSSYRHAMHGSDAWMMTLEQAAYEHPRNLNSTTLVIAPALAGKTSLRTAVELLSSRPAAQFGIRRRGALGVGDFADVVVADPARAQEFLDDPGPHDAYPEVVRWVVINGQVVLDDAAHTGHRPGRVLRAT